ncbi:MAG: hypothetical protein ACR2IE_00800 [Candidatus Sumerlaeaceae bacterium]
MDSSEVSSATILNDALQFAFLQRSGSVCTTIYPKQIHWSCDLIQHGLRIIFDAKHITVSEDNDVLARRGRGRLSQTRQGLSGIS